MFSDSGQRMALVGKDQAACQKWQGRHGSAVEGKSRRIRMDRARRR